MTSPRGTAAIALAALIACSGTNTAPPPGPGPKRGDPPEVDTRARTAELDRLFGELLPRWVVALNNPGDDAAARTALLDAARSSLPAGTFAQLQGVIAAARAAASAAEPEVGDASDRLDDEVAELDRLLSAASLGYQIDASVITSGASRQVLLFTFAVDRVRRYRSGAAIYNALWVSRLDQLAFRYRLVGLAAERRDAMVLPARIDEWLVREILGVVAAPERWRDGRERASSELPAAIRAALVADLGAVAGDGLAPLAAAIEERRELFEAVHERLAAAGVALQMPSTLALDGEWRDAFARVATAGETARLDAIERTLGELDAQIAFGKIRELAIAAVEHHEIQHQIDAAAGLAGLEDLAPVEVVARRELSAYLAEVARNRPGAHLAVVKLAGFALSPGAAALEREVASTIIANLAAKLGGAADSRGAEALSVATAAILLRDREQIARAAAGLWADHFGAPLAELQLEDAGAGSQAAP